MTIMDTRMVTAATAHTEVMARIKQLEVATDTLMAPRKLMDTHTAVKDTVTLIKRSRTDIRTVRRDTGTRTAEEGMDTLMVAKGTSMIFFCNEHGKFFELCAFYYCAGTMRNIKKSIMTTKSTIVMTGTIRLGMITTSMIVMMEMTTLGMTTVATIMETMTTQTTRMGMITSRNFLSFPM